MQIKSRLKRSAIAGVSLMAAVSMNAPTALAIGNVLPAHAIISKPAVSNSVHDVRWRGRGWRYGHRHRGYGWGPAVGLGIAALIIGGSIAASRERYNDRWEDCADRYRSFSWRDGTFQPYGGGPRELCPYLRY